MYYDKVLIESLKLAAELPEFQESSYGILRDLELIYPNIVFKDYVNTIISISENIIKKSNPLDTLFLVIILSDFNLPSYKVLRDYRLLLQEEIITRIENNKFNLELKNFFMTALTVILKEKKFIVFNNRVWFYDNISYYDTEFRNCTNNCSAFLINHINFLTEIPDILVDTLELGKIRYFRKIDC